MCDGGEQNQLPGRERKGPHLPPSVCWEQSAWEETEALKKLPLCYLSIEFFRTQIFHSVKINVTANSIIDLFSLVISGTHKLRKAWNFKRNGSKF